jgi:hypothetical protein
VKRRESLKKAKSSSLSMMFRQEFPFKIKGTRSLIRLADVGAGTTDPALNSLLSRSPS